jgi:hypothetical protein
MGRMTIGPSRRLGASAELAVTSPAPFDDWTQVLHSAPAAMPFQTPTWLRCVCDVGGWEDASRLYRTPEGRRLVLPMVRRRLFGTPLTQLEALPDGWGPGGLLAEGDGISPEDVQLVMADLARGHALRAQVRPDPTTAATWQAGMPAGVRAVPRMSQTVDLDGGFGNVWRKRFRADTRNRIRKAQRAGVTIERDEIGRLAPTFQELYAKSVVRWAQRDGEPVAAAQQRAARREPPRKLATVTAHLGVDCKLYGAFVGGEPVAAIVVLWGPTTVAYWRGAMNEDLAGRTYANYLLHSTAIEDAAEAGRTVYHMGDSAPVSSLALFKSRFGAVERHYASYRIESAPVVALRHARRGVLKVLGRA